MSRLVLTNATAVLPDRVVENATLVAEEGFIVEVIEGGTAEHSAVDVRGALVLPGLVDSHSDGLERDLRPRPGVEMDAGFALSSYEGRARGAGVTTVFHGVAYEDDLRQERTVEQAGELLGVIDRRVASGAALLDHRVLLRVDARSPRAFEEFRVVVDELIASADGEVPLVSFEDHTPGQGQYSDFGAYRTAVRGTMTDDELDRYLEQVIAVREQHAGQRDVALAWLSVRALDGRIRLLSHDPSSAEEIALRQRQGVAVAEFPTTLEAAKAARDRGLAIVAGAPNVLRGRSHSGNVSAAELVANGVVDGLSSDYMPSTLLSAAVALALRSVAPLPVSVGLVTGGAARVTGLGDRGELTPGNRADIVVATIDGPWPTVRAVYRAEEQRDDETGTRYAFRTDGALLGRIA